MLRGPEEGRESEGSTRLTGKQRDKVGLSVHAATVDRRGEREVLQKPERPKPRSSRSAAEIGSGSPDEGAVAPRQTGDEPRTLFSLLLLILDYCSAVVYTHI